MNHIREKTVFLSAFMLWFLVGAMLLKKGFFYLSPFEGFEVLLLSGVALLVGVLKGKFVLGKKARKNIATLRQKNVFDSFLRSFTAFYSVSFFLILGVMAFLGWQLTYWQVPFFWRGLIDVAVGVALLQGSLVYFWEGVVKQA